MRYGNTAAESVSSLYKKEFISRVDRWEDVNQVTLATLDWVSWYNTHRLYSACGDIPPHEYEQNYHKLEWNSARLMTPIG